MTRTELQEIIDREFGNFIEFPGDRREAVTETSCKLFAQHVVEVIQARPAVPDELSARVIEQAAAMKAEFEKLRKDAERYRYIRKGNQWIVAATRTGFHVDGEELDDLVDSEMEQ